MRVSLLSMLNKQTDKQQPETKNTRAIGKPMLF